MMFRISLMCAMLVMWSVIHTTAQDYDYIPESGPEFKGIDNMPSYAERLVPMGNSTWMMLGLYGTGHISNSSSGPYRYATQSEIADIPNGVVTDVSTGTVYAFLHHSETNILELKDIVSDVRTTLSVPEYIEHVATIYMNGDTIVIGAGNQLQREFNRQAPGCFMSVNFGRQWVQMPAIDKVNGNPNIAHIFRSMYGATLIGALSDRYPSSIEMYILNANDSVNWKRLRTMSGIYNSRSYCYGWYGDQLYRFNAANASFDTILKAVLPRSSEILGVRAMPMDTILVSYKQSDTVYVIQVVESTYRIINTRKIATYGNTHLLERIVLVEASTDIVINSPDSLWHMTYPYNVRTSVRASPPAYPGYAFYDVRGKTIAMTRHGFYDISKPTWKVPYETNRGTPSSSLFSIFMSYAEQGYGVFLDRDACYIQHSDTSIVLPRSILIDASTRSESISMCVWKDSIYSSYLGKGILSYPLESASAPSDANAGLPVKTSPYGYMTCLFSDENALYGLRAGVGEQPGLWTYTNSVWKPLQTDSFMHAQVYDVKRIGSRVSIIANLSTSTNVIRICWFDMSTGIFKYVYCDSGMYIPQDCVGSPLSDGRVLLGSRTSSVAWIATPGDSLRLLCKVPLLYDVYATDHDIFVSSLSWGVLRLDTSSLSSVTGTDASGRTPKPWVVVNNILSLDDNWANTITQVDIVDVNGTLVKSVSHNPIDIADLASGWYGAITYHADGSKVWLSFMKHY